MGAASVDAVVVGASAAVPGLSADSYPAAGVPADILAAKGVPVAPAAPADCAAAAAVVAVADAVGGVSVEHAVEGRAFAAVSAHTIKVNHERRRKEVSQFCWNQNCRQQPPSL